MPKRHNSRRKANDPAALAARLPVELKSFDALAPPGRAQGLPDRSGGLCGPPRPVPRGAGGWPECRRLVPPNADKDTMTALPEIPGCPYHPGRGDTWPRHKFKARNKRANRRLAIIELNRNRNAGPHVACLGGYGSRGRSVDGRSDQGTRIRIPRSPSPRG
jgi:hypothetical protein